MKYILFTAIIALALLAACTPYDDSKEYKSTSTKTIKSPPVADDEINVDVTHSVYIPGNGDAPIAGQRLDDDPDAVLTFRNIGDKFSVNNGQTVNFIYDGINPEETYILYQSTLEGYDLELATLSDTKLIQFNKLCQTFVVANPSITVVKVPNDLRYEQIVWTPRVDGSWEVRCGTVERGCQSQALDALHKLRSSGYQKSIPR